MAVCQRSGYSKRSKVETTFHRYKAIVGSAMRARGLAAQRVEARIGCKILNTMTALGMPDSEMIGCLRCLLLVMCTHPFAKKSVYAPFIAQRRSRALFWL